MSVVLDGDIIHLSGLCRVEDAEPLLGHLLADGGRQVDLTDAEHLHAAVLQVLLAFHPVILGAPNDSFVAKWLMPLLLRGVVA